MSFVITEDEVHNLVFGVFHHFFACLKRIGLAGTGIEQTQEVVDFGDGTHGGTWVFVRGFLLNANNGAQPRNFIHVGAFQVVQKVAGIGRECFDVAPLTLCIERVEGQRRFAAAAQSRHNRQAVAGNGYVHVFQVMNAGAQYFYLWFILVALQV